MKIEIKNENEIIEKIKDKFSHNPNKANKLISIYREKKNEDLTIDYEKYLIPSLGVSILGPEPGISEIMEEENRNLWEKLRLVNIFIEYKNEEWAYLIRKGETKGMWVHRSALAECKDDSTYSVVFVP